MSIVAIPNLAQTPNVGIEDLEQLMRSVNDTAQQLQQTHVALRSEVAHLQHELAEANDQLRRSRSLAALGEMAAGIAHEVRNPLASIQLYVQMLAEDLSGKPQQTEVCEKIACAIKGLDDVVRDVLLFACDKKVHTTHVPPSMLIDRALGTCESLLADGDITVVRQDAENSQFSLPVDAGLFVLALSNVMRNAADAMIEARSPQRELRTDVLRRMHRHPDGRRTQMAAFSVADTGPGVDQQVVERMFNPFFTTRKTGTGLGLAIVHRIVDAHGGHVSVENRSEGGAEVTLFLPLSGPEDTEPTTLHGRGRLAAAPIADNSSPKEHGA